MSSFKQRCIGVAIVASAVAASAAPAQAANQKMSPSCSWSSGFYACTQTFTQSGGVHGWDIESTKPIEVTVIGARGGRAGNGTGGGLGGEVKTTIQAADICLTIGSAGGDASGANGGGGGANGGGRGGNGPYGAGGGGGGGATTVRASPYYSPCNVAGGTLLAVGPGGGGGAASTPGGNAGVRSGSSSCGGNAGVASSGGRGGTGCSGGSFDGTAGTAGQGGNGGGTSYTCSKYECLIGAYEYSGGGGGGGGVYGGGGGGSPKSVKRDGLSGGAGGGGGGSASGAVRTSTVLPSVKLTWYPPNPPSMLTNASFEEPALPAGSWDHKFNVPGWTDVNGRPIEIMSYAGDAASGKQYIEIDANVGSSLQATFPSAAYQQYRITFKYAARPGYGADQNRLYFTAYHWVGAPQLEGVLTADGTGSSKPVWKEFSGVFMAHNLLSTIVLREDAPSNGVGMFVDDFSVTPIG